ncbi:hypothetical protein HG264_07700 [Pseudomonas sp. gcc21]|uniref:hypothetical protein n=1 Tax=Pseudomonas sp. gcc21 TaxID=2726989 RepID=UPI0014518E1C|nr:hypothetical protein [Pseudomonas sp. gcc21]QJD58800.1 hypothetical protein HG264_07700 [Pseudomonas sp. gcc21]
MNALKKLTTAVAFASLSLVGATAMAQSPAAQGTDPGPDTKLGTEGHSMTGKGATGDTGQATGQGNTMQHGATGREAEGGHGMDYDRTEKRVDKEEKRSGGGSSNSRDSSSSTGQGSTGSSNTGSSNRDSDTMSAPGHSAKDQGGMSDPARTADRPGVTGAPNEVERSQRDIDDSN